MLTKKNYRNFYFPEGPSAAPPDPEPSADDTPITGTRREVFMNAIAKGCNPGVPPSTKDEAALSAIAKAIASGEIGGGGEKEPIPDVVINVAISKDGTTCDKTFAELVAMGESEKITAKVCLWSKSGAFSDSKGYFFDTLGPYSGRDPVRIVLNEPLKFDLFKPTDALAGNYQAETANVVISASDEVSLTYTSFFLEGTQST